MSANNPLWRFAPSPFSRLAARCGKRDAARAAGRPLHGGPGFFRTSFDGYGFAMRNGSLTC